MDKKVYEGLSKEQLIMVIGKLQLRISELVKENDLLKIRKDTPQPINIKITPVEEFIANNPRREEIYNILSNPDGYRLSEDEVDFLKSIINKVGLSARQKSWFEGIKKRLK